jgi:hypothetical protein
MSLTIIVYIYQTQDCTGNTSQLLEERVPVDVSLYYSIELFV